jgi:hypothetical protein
MEREVVVGVGIGYRCGCGSGDCDLIGRGGDEGGW